MSSHIPHDEARARRASTQIAPSGPYIDWGPDLPARYAGGRARVIVANPHAIFVSWESDLGAPDHWLVEVDVGLGEPTTYEVPGKTPDLWAQVPARTSGVVRLARVEAGEKIEVAALPFETPADGPSWRTDERWGRLGRQGQVAAGAVVVGNRVEESGLAGVPGADGEGGTGGQLGYMDAVSGPSSSTVSRR